MATGKLLSTISDSNRKTCSKCRIEKAITAFHKRVASSDGLAYKCMSCVNSDSEAWRKDHPTAHADWYQENKERKSQYFKAWREKHKESEPLRMLEWAKKNPHITAAKNAKRHAMKFRAVPKWANHEAIALIYAEAARLRKETGLRYEVDHVVPLQSKYVCGLHWEGNLQILTEFQNISKHNRHWPGMA